MILGLFFWYSRSLYGSSEDKRGPGVRRENTDITISWEAYSTDAGHEIISGASGKESIHAQEGLLIFGVISDRRTDQPVEASVTFQAIRDGRTYEYMYKTNRRGEYRMALEPNTVYEVIVEAFGYAELRQKFNTSDIQEHEFRIDFKVDPKAVPDEPSDFPQLSMDQYRRGPGIEKIAEPQFNPFSISGNVVPEVYVTNAGTGYQQDSLAEVLVQDSIPDPVKLKVFLDCDFCDLNDIKQNIQFVNYVRDKQDAEFHLLITRRNSGSGGEELTFFLSGLGQYSVAEDNYIIDIHAAATEAEMRNKILKGIQAGLLRQLVNSGAIDHITIGYTESGNTNSAPRNHWNNWVFDIGLSGYYARDAVYTERSLYTNLSAIRITEKWKTEFTTNGSFFYGTYKYGDDTYTAYNRIVNLKSLIVRSGGPRFSWGLRGMAEYSTFSNYALRLELFPSVEYNLYPYTESSRHQLSALYGIGLVHNNFLDTTIFNLMRQDLWGQNLSVAMKFIETWGNLTVGVSGISYLSNTDFYRVTLSSEALFRLYRGFNLQIRGGVSVIHDQFNLPKGGADFEQVLLQQREMLSSYYYWFVVGLNFTFGDIYNSIVNPRFTQLF
jgi:hypothetical protein